MIKIQAQKVANSKVIIDLQELYQLIDRARKVEEVEFNEIESDIPIEALMRLTETGGAFDFLNDPREDIYSIEDLKVRYK